MPVQKPQLISKPFAANGDRILPPNSASALVANQDTGYPERQQQPLDENGLPVNRAETNGNFNLYSQHILWVETGGQYTFEQEISDEIGGYNINSILWCASNNTYQRSLTNNNTANFVTNPEYINDGTNWITQGNSSAPTVTTLAATAITGTSMILNADLVALGYEGIVSAGFQYRLAGSSVWIDTVFAELDRFQTYNSPITGLSTNTTYEFRAVAIGLDNPNNNAYGAVLTATTQNISPSDYTINIVGPTAGSFNDALNTTNVNTVINGTVNNDTALVVANANNCTAATREYAQITGDPDFVSINTLYQFDPLKLAIDAATTKDTIVVTSPISGLLINGSPLWCDDSGTMKDVIAGNVVETKVTGTPSTNSLLGLTAYSDFCSFVDGGDTYVVSSNGIAQLSGSFYVTYIYISKLDGSTIYQIITNYGNAIDETYSAGTIYEYAGEKYLAALFRNGALRVFKWNTISKQFIRLESSDVNILGTYGVCSIVLSGINYVLACTANNTILCTIGANGKLTNSTSKAITGTANYREQIKPFYYLGDSYVVLQRNPAIIIYKYIAGSWSSIQSINNRTAPIVTIGSDGNIYLASNSGTIDNPIVEIRKWDGTQFTIIIGTVALPLQVHGLYNSCDVLYQGQSLFAFNNYIISNFADICKYTCTGLSPTLTNAPTWVAKGGQSFASSVTTSSGAPAYVTDTMSTITRTGDILIATTAARSVSGRYVRLRISLNLNDTASRYYAGFLV